MLPARFLHGVVESAGGAQVWRLLSAGWRCGTTCCTSLKIAFPPPCPASAGPACGDTGLPPLTKFVVVFADAEAPASNSAWCPPSPSTSCFHHALQFPIQRVQIVVQFISSTQIAESARAPGFCGDPSNLTGPRRAFELPRMPYPVAGPGGGRGCALRLSPVARCMMELLLYLGFVRARWGMSSCPSCCSERPGRAPSSNSGFPLEG